jgi:hypothetical protein
MNQPHTSQENQPPPAYEHNVYPPPQLPATDPRRRSPAVAAILSMMPGLGQVYLGYTRRGFIHIGVVGCIIALLASDPPEGFIGIAALVLPFFWLYNRARRARTPRISDQSCGERLSAEL